MYGMPDLEMQKKYDQGKIKLGGCSIDIDNMPDRYCNKCEHEWFKNSKKNPNRRPSFASG